MKSINYKKCRITIASDPDAESPRTWDNVGEILYTSSRYDLGDRRATPQEIEAIINRSDVVYLPVYAYVHSGVRIQTSPFACPWDSGQCGIIWCTKDRAIKAWGRKRFTQTVKNRALHGLAAEIETLNLFYQGEVVGFVAEDPDGDRIDSCWGYYPDDSQGSAHRWDYPINDAKASIDHWRQARARALKAARRTAQLEREQHLSLI